MIFKSWEEAEKLFDDEMGCISDDVDKEEARLMRWMESSGHEVEE